MVVNCTRSHAPGGSAATYSSIHLKGSAYGLDLWPSGAGQGLPRRTTGFLARYASNAGQSAAAAAGVRIPAVPPGPMRACSAWLGSLYMSTCVLSAGMASSVGHLVPNFMGTNSTPSTSAGALGPHL